MNSGNANWVFEITKTGIPMTNSDVDLIYNYKYNAQATGWMLYENDTESIVSPFVLPDYQNRLDGYTLPGV